MLQMYHAVMRFSLNKSEQAHVSQDAQDSESAEEAPAGAPAEAPEDAVKPTVRGLRG